MTGNIYPLSRATLLRDYLIDADSHTVLPVYRNSGLFVDRFALTLEKEELQRGVKAFGGGELPLFIAGGGHDFIVEWEAMYDVDVD